MAKHQTKAEREHVCKVAALGCVACFVQSGEWFTPGQIHHTRKGQGTAQRSPWKKTICLCVNHHIYSGSGKYAFHAGQQTFEAHYGTEEELLALTLENI